MKTVLPLEEKVIFMSDDDITKAGKSFGSTFKDIGKFAASYIKRHPVKAALIIGVGIGLAVGLGAAAFFSGGAAFAVGAALCPLIISTGVLGVAGKRDSATKEMKGLKKVLKNDALGNSKNNIEPPKPTPNMPRSTSKDIGP